MAKRGSGVTKAIETWQTRKGTQVKIAVRHTNGRFHGATNFGQRPVR